MTAESHSDPLIVAVIRRFRLTWYRATALVGAVIISLLILITFLNGDNSYFSDPSFWRSLLDGPVMITYILVVYLHPGGISIYVAAV
jgi:hypothetical protein